MPMLVGCEPLDVSFEADLKQQQDDPDLGQQSANSGHQRSLRNTSVFSHFLSLSVP
jgi:hypothetical protein